MTIDVRTLDPADWDTWYGVLEWAFGGVPESAEERALWRGLTEPERSLTAWDEGSIVGTYGVFSFELSVPGGAVVPSGGVTMVSVAATHRRRGLLRRMMTRGIEEIRAAGEPLAVLTASEAGIYGRFGFGVATRGLFARIDAHRVSIARPPGADALRLRVVEPEAELARCEELYARLVPERPGMLRRRPGWERLALLDPEQDRAGASPLRCVLAEREDGELVGYARYALKPEWDGHTPAGTVLVRNLDAVEPAAYAALLDFLTNIDLMSTVQLRDRPLDDPLTHLVSDTRLCHPRLTDRLYVRPVEVGPALAARSYATEVDVVLEVADAFCPWNAGRWRLSGGPRGAVCERTREPAELALTVRELGAAYLGGTSLAELAGAGLVTELRRGALPAAATAFRHPRAPWLPHGF